MLKQGCVEDIRKGRLKKSDGRLIIVTRHYPRGLKRDLFDDFRSSLAPKRDLLNEFRRKVMELSDHNAAFDAMAYDTKFQLNKTGWEELERLSKLSRGQDMYVICHCKVEEMCHRELLLLLAEKYFSAEIEPIHNSHPDFRLLDVGPPKDCL